MKEVFGLFVETFQVSASVAGKNAPYGVVRPIVLIFYFARAIEVIKTQDNEASSAETRRQLAFPVFLMHFKRGCLLR